MGLTLTKEEYPRSGKSYHGNRGTVEMVLRKDGFCVVILCQSYLECTRYLTGSHRHAHKYTQTLTSTDTGGQPVYSLKGNVESCCQCDELKRMEEKDCGEVQK